jgi:hypothetical protein
MRRNILRASRLLLGGLPLAAGCHQRAKPEPMRPPIDGVRFMARAALVTPGDTLLEVRVRAVNTGQAIRTLEFGNCSMNLGVASVGQTPERKWEYLGWSDARRPGHSCEPYLATRDLAPGASVSPSDYIRRVPIRAILGDSLPPGRYRVTARVTANGRPSLQLESGDVELGLSPARRSVIAARGGAGR